jgi:hypothetical protein
MWANVENNRILAGGGEGGDKHRKKSWRWYNRKRWTVWEDGLVTALRNCTDEETKKLITDALACIKRVVGRILIYQENGTIVKSSSILSHTVSPKTSS